MTQTTIVEFTRDLDRQMRQHLEPAYPSEGCGIMIGHIDDQTAVVTRIVGAENQNTERGHDRFEIDPLFYYKTEQSLAAGEHVIGFFHSHPDCPEIASETDREFALNWPDFVWIIYRVDNGSSAGVRSWIVDDKTEQFTEMTIEIV